MNDTSRYAYLHGFASSPLSTKGTQLAAALAATGLELQLPNLARPDFATMTWTASLQALDAMHAEAGTPDARWSLVGSSMGGYLAARWAQLHPERVERLVLLCPGFDMNHRWPQIVGADGMTRWRAHGRLAFPDATGTMTPLHWGFIEDAMDHPAWPDVPCPTLIIHGRNDEVVPIESSRTYALSRPRVRLLEVDDDHALTASLDRIRDEMMAFFALSPAPKKTEPTR